MRGEERGEGNRPFYFREHIPPFLSPRFLPPFLESPHFSSDTSWLPFLSLSKTPHNLQSSSFWMISLYFSLNPSSNHAFTLSFTGYPGSSTWPSKSKRKNEKSQHRIAEKIDRKRTFALARENEVSQGRVGREML